MSAFRSGRAGSKYIIKEQDIFFIQESSPSPFNNKKVGDVRESFFPRCNVTLGLCISFSGNDIPIKRDSRSL
jgi:hypothetical protein